MIPHRVTYVCDLDNDFRRLRCTVCKRSFRVLAGAQIPDDCTGQPYAPKTAIVPSAQSPIPNPPGQSVAPLWQRPKNTAETPSDREKYRRAMICAKRCDEAQRQICAPPACATALATLVERGQCALGKWDRSSAQSLPPGLISAADQWCIQIEITNACPRHCSNCTRHCPHIREPFYMDADTFERAVRSMDGYPGMLGIQGGEPTLHPHFADLLDVYTRLWQPGHGEVDWGRRPIEDFGGYVADQLSDTLNRRGLWSATGPGYYKHFEAIQDTFPYQCLNDHANPAKHAPLLVTRKELGISDADWLRYRDRCWVQRQWSSSITPKGCFPCEIMASLDMLYDGPGGWPIEPGWWKRQSADFGAMLDWCEQCGACLPLAEREAREGIHDVSLHHLEQLWRLGSPAVRDGRYRVFDVAAWKPQDVRQDGDRYMPAEYRRKRVAAANRSIKPRRLEGFVVSVGCGEQLARVLPANAGHFDRFVVVTSSEDTQTQEVALATEGPIELVISDDCYKNGDAFNKGRMLSHGLAALRLTDWVLNLDADILLPAGFGERIRRLVLNPGCLYYARRRALAADGTLGRSGGTADDFAPWGYFQLWNVRAKALAKLSQPGALRYPECFVSAGNVDTWWQLHWPWSKKIPLALAEDPAWDVGHVPHGPLTARWNGAKPNGGWRYAGQNNIQPGTPKIEPGRGGFLRIVRVDDCHMGVVPVDSVRPGVPDKTRIYEYQWRADFYDADALTTWEAFFRSALK